MNGYEYWLPKLANYSIPTIPPSLECTNVSSDDTSDDIRETEIDKTTIKSTSKKTRVHGVVLPYILSSAAFSVSEKIRRLFKQYDVHPSL